VTPFVTAGAGFLVAVLWFDLMFDVQVLPYRSGEIPGSVLTSIAGYYGRVTTAARPMNRLIAAAMLGTLAAIIVQLTASDTPAAVGVASLLLAAGPIGLATVHTVPSAVRLGTEADPPATQARLARSICRDHLLCLASVTALLGLQLAAGS
jgi:hypothetical protein